MGEFKKAAAHYKGVLRAAERMQAMGHTTASGGGGGTPPNKGCRGNSAKALFLIIGMGTLLIMGISELLT